MRLIQSIINNLKSPRDLAIKILALISPLIKSDKAYISLRYRLFMNKKLNLDNPRTFNEKQNWLKLYYHDPIFPKLVDKYEVKHLVSEKIGASYIIPTLGVWDCVEDIDFNILPDKFVLKCTHDSGGLIICRDKKTLDIEKAKNKLKAALRRNYFMVSREWGYKYVKPRIIAEQFMENENEVSISDYKFFCFNGEPKLLFVATDRESEVKFNFFDSKFCPLNIINGHPQNKELLKKPILFEEMKRIAATLSQDYPFMRVDLYEINNHIYFGEFTLYHYGGTMPFYPEIWDYRLGEYINLPSKRL